MPVFHSAPLRRNHDQRVMLLRALSKLGICSRQQAKRAIHGGRVSVNGKVSTSHTHWVNLQRVRLDHLPAPEALRRLETGIRILDCVSLPAKIELETSTPAVALNENQTDAAEPWLRITIREGKNRQVRRMFAALGYEVRQLIRLRFGPLELGGLPVGHWRYLMEHEIAGLCRAVEA